MIAYIVPEPDYLKRKALRDAGAVARQALDAAVDVIVEQAVVAERVRCAQVALRLWWRPWAITRTILQGEA